ncbi:MAG: histidine kinase [Defluviitaleaceae bacterium]|nr:histidine kinase [Defluviitaleaceae bacterium]
MNSITKTFYITIMIFGFCLLFVQWFAFSLGGETAGFFLILTMVCLSLFRWRFPRYKWTVLFDCLLCVVINPWALILALFAGFYYRVYFVGIAVIFAAVVSLEISAIVALGGIGGLFLGLWEKECERSLSRRDTEAGRYYELESLQSDLLSATAQIERMTVVSERARIAREIHDNAGHEIVAAFISLQTARGEMDSTTSETALRLYDSALERLDVGVNKIREAVHNLAPVTALEVDALREICEKFPSTVAFNIFGNTNNVPVHIWSTLEACLSEALTNAAKHAKGKNVTVNLDATPHIIRLCVENKTSGIKAKTGSGLRNLRHRAAAVGGSLSSDASDGNFRVICVIPLRNERF